MESSYTCACNLGCRSGTHDGFECLDNDACVEDTAKMEAVPILLLATMVMKLLAVSSMNMTIVHAAAMAHERTQSVHSLAHAMMISKETDFTILDIDRY